MVEGRAGGGAHHFGGLFGIVRSFEKVQGDVVIRCVVLKDASA